MIVITINESSQSRLMAETAAANTRISSSGLLNCAASVASGPPRDERADLVASDVGSASLGLDRGQAAALAIECL